MDAEFLRRRDESICLLRRDPHNPARHLRLGLVHSELGFPDLAAADAYRALTLLDSVIDPESSEYQATKRCGLSDDADSLVNGVASVSFDGGDSNDEEEEGSFEPVSRDEYFEIIRDVYRLLVSSLVQCGCMRDAYDFCLQGLKIPDQEGKESSDEVLEAQLNLIKQSYVDRKRRKMGDKPKENGDTSEDLAGFKPADLNGQGAARRVVYPWNTHEPDREAPETLQLLNERLKQVAPKCEVRSVALPTLYDDAKGTKTNGEKAGAEPLVSIQLGLVATEDLAPGETILRESSLLTATNRLHDDLCDACNGPLPALSSAESSVACEECDDTIFCSQKCHDLAQEIYHGAQCGQIGLESIGKDISDPKDKADYLYLLLLGRALAMAATQDVHPLDLPEVKYIWGDFRPLDEPLPTATLPFSFHLNILQPMRILEEMGIDPFSSLNHYDTWIFNTLYAKFRGTASGRLSTWDGGPEVCAVHPLWCLANHSCDPNVRWEWGGEITFTVRDDEGRVKWRDGGNGGKKGAKGGIKKGEEILNHYCDLGLSVKERREWAMGALGGKCLCERCVWEAAHGK